MDNNIVELLYKVLSMGPVFFVRYVLRRYKEVVIWDKYMDLVLCIRQCKFMSLILKKALYFYNIIYQSFDYCNLTHIQHCPTSSICQKYYEVD